MQKEEELYRELYEIEFNRRKELQAELKEANYTIEWWQKRYMALSKKYKELKRESQKDKQ